MIAFTRTPPKIALPVIALILILCTLLQQACRKTEFNGTPPLHEVDFATKFFTTKGNESEAVLQLIEKLKIQNQQIEDMVE